MNNMWKYEFRAWDKETKKMLYIYQNDTILFRNGKCTIWKENQYNETEECYCCKTFNNVIPMQYTGLKDKNGKKIYEGDIVRCWSGKPENYLDYTELIGSVEYIEPYWRVDGNELAWNAEFIEVIGNIYENPRKKSKPEKKLKEE